MLDCIFVLADRFALEDGCIKGSDAIVVAAKDLANGGAACMCKFIISQAEFTKELHLHELFSDTQSPIPGDTHSFSKNCLTDYVSQNSLYELCAPKQRGVGKGFGGATPFK